jgi:hypothetical protein
MGPQRGHGLPQEGNVIRGNGSTALDNVTHDPHETSLVGLQDGVSSKLCEKKDLIHASGDVTPSLVLSEGFISTQRRDVVTFSGLAKGVAAGIPAGVSQGNAELCHSTAYWRIQGSNVPHLSTSLVLCSIVRDQDVHMIIWKALVTHV